jgi:hypothetical protein
VEGGIKDTERKRKGNATKERIQKLEKRNVNCSIAGILRSKM